MCVLALSIRTTDLTSPNSYFPRTGHKNSLTQDKKYSPSTVPASLLSEISSLNTVWHAQGLNPFTSPAAIKVYLTELRCHSLTVVPSKFLRDHPLLLLPALRSL